MEDRAVDGEREREPRAVGDPERGAGAVASVEVRADERQQPEVSAGIRREPEREPEAGGVPPAHVPVVSAHHSGAKKRKRHGHAPQPR